MALREEGSQGGSCHQRRFPGGEVRGTGKAEGSRQEGDLPEARIDVVFKAEFAGFLFLF